MCGIGTSSAADPLSMPKLLSWWKVRQIRIGCNSSRLKYCEQEGKKLK